MSLTPFAIQHGPNPLIVIAVYVGIFVVAILLGVPCAAVLVRATSRQACWLLMPVFAYGWFVGILYVLGVLFD